MKLHFVLAVILLFASRGVAWPQVPLPTDLSIQPPGASVLAADAAFSGAWGNGAWDGSVPTALIVEQVDEDGTAKVIYSRGSSEHPQTAARWLRLTGRIEDHCLTIHLPDPNSSAGFRVQYRIMAPGRLEGDLTTWDSWRTQAFLQRIPGPPAAIIATAALPFRPIWHEIRIPEHSLVGAASGRTIELAATLYRSRLPGRQPLVILNHGSAAVATPAATPADAVARTWHFEAEARFFLAHGFNVVVPMRKGRGRSGGPFLEPGNPIIPTAIQVASAVEDEDTVVNAMRAEPWVDPARIIVAGWSRGGGLSVVYTARHPDKVAGVINFSGGWWGEYYSGPGAVARESRQLLAAAGKTARVPELWLYADNDMYFSTAYARKVFDAFRSNGGTGNFLAFGKVSGVPSSTAGDGHALFEHVSMWNAVVAAYLRRTEDARIP
jgi:dienelactone hydrolase